MALKAEVLGGVPYEEFRRQTDKWVAEYRSKYGREPSAEDIARYRASWGTVDSPAWRGPAAASVVAAESCGASGMAVWHFLVLCIIAIFLFAMMQWVKKEMQ